MPRLEENTKPKLQTVDIVGSTVLLVSSVVLAWLYVSKENALYFHDFNFYQLATLLLKQKFFENPLEALLMIAGSTSQTYNFLYTVPLIPLQAIFGETRMAFIEGVVVLYLIPYLLSLGAIFSLASSDATKNATGSSRGLTSSDSTSSDSTKRRWRFWLCTFVAFAIPSVWASVLRGYPDVGAALLVNLAAVLYLRDMRLSTKKQIICIGLLLGLAPLVRRHFVYTDVAFMIALLAHQLAIYKMVPGDDVGKIEASRTDDSAGAARGANPLNIEDAILAKQEKSYNILYEGGSNSIDIDGDHEVEATPRIATSILRVAFVGCTAGLFLATIGCLFTYDVLTHNYPEIYRSFHVPLGQGIEYFLLSYGVIPWVMAIAGFVLFIIKDRNDLKPSLFIASWILLDIAIWLLLAGQLGIHYTLHFNAFLIIGIASLFSFLSTLPRSLSLGLAVPCVAFLLFNLSVGLSFLGGLQLSSPGWLNLFERKASVPGNLFSSNYHPLVRTDKKEAFALIKTLRQLAPNKAAVLVAAGSDILNDDTIRNAERELFGMKEQKLRILKAPYTDSEECYPLEQLLEAEVVIVPATLQVFLEPEQQNVLKAILLCFQDNWPLAGDFEKESKTFKLDNGVQVALYHRVKPTSIETAVDALERIKKIVPKRPSGQPDWIGSGLEKISSTAFDTKRNSFEFGCEESEQPRFLLSTESLARGRGTFGKVGASCDGGPLVLSLKALSNDGTTVEQKEVTVAVDKEFDWTNDTEKDCYFVVIPPSESNSGNMKKDGQLILKDLSLR